jgi:hypothetical protein
MGRQPNHRRPLRTRTRNAPYRFTIACWYITFTFLLSFGPQVFSQVSLLDRSFMVGAGTDKWVNDLVVLQDQRILVGGDFSVINGSSNSYLARIYADGAIDESYNPRGATDGAVFSMHQQPDGKTLVGGTFSTLLGAKRRGIARLLQDGSIDPDFETGDLLATNGGAFSFALQADGRIMMGIWMTWDSGGLPGYTQMACLTIRSCVPTGLGGYRWFSCKWQTIAFYLVGTSRK